jgi:hypothetical protein
LVLVEPLLQVVLLALLLQSQLQAVVEVEHLTKTVLAVAQVVVQVQTLP